MAAGGRAASANLLTNRECADGPTAGTPVGLDREPLPAYDVLRWREVRIGGVGGIVGTKPKRGRRPEHVQLTQVDRAVSPYLDALVLLTVDTRVAARQTPDGTGEHSASLAIPLPS